MNGFPAIVVARGKCFLGRDIPVDKRLRILADGHLIRRLAPARVFLYEIP
jgi:hypothetical protein